MISVFSHLMTTLLVVKYSTHIWQPIPTFRVVQQYDTSHAYYILAFETFFMVTNVLRYITGNSDCQLPSTSIN